MQYVCVLRIEIVFAFRECLLSRFYCIDFSPLKAYFEHFFGKSCQQESDQQESKPNPKPIQTVNNESQIDPNRNRDRNKKVEVNPTETDPQ